VSAPLVLFWLFGVLTVGSAAGVVSLRNTVSAAMALVATFFGLAGLYVLLLAHTIAVLQVLVYAGAIMVLFLFVIMLLNMPEVPRTEAAMGAGQVLGGLGAVGLLAALSHVMFHLPSQAGPDRLSDTTKLLHFGTLKELGGLLYTTYLLPFEAVSLLLLVAMVGAVVVAKSRI
jgi:NADH-quinone oxidoreductase subunit J